MLDKITFMETLRSVAEIARTSSEPLSREEINKYFETMDLSKEQQEMVYQYILTPQTEPETNAEEDTSNNETERVITDSDSTTTIDAPSDEDSLSTSAFFQMYLEDINDLPEYTVTEIETLYSKLLDGDNTVIQLIADHWLRRVIEIAQTYSSEHVNIEDVIQEGNIGLLLALTTVAGTKQTLNIEDYLQDAIKQSMMTYIDEITNEEDWGSTIIAKVTLIHEAQKALQEQLDRKPTTEELSNYTNLTEEELSDILELYRELTK